MSGYELVTVLRSNLYELINPDLVLQLNILKAHIGIKSFNLLFATNHDRVAAL